MPERAVILLADDRDDDVLLIRRAFETGEIHNPLFVVNSGDDAIAYLSGEGKYASRDEYPLPELLLLDLKMPGTDGFDVLRSIRSHPGLSSLRVVVLTSSEDIRDVNFAYQLGANSFMVKDMDFRNSVEMARIITNYWLCLSKTPEISRPPKVEKARKDKREG